MYEIEPTSSKSTAMAHGHQMRRKAHSYHRWTYPPSALHLGKQAMGLVHLDNTPPLKIFEPNFLELHTRYLVKQVTQYES